MIGYDDVALLQPGVIGWAKTLARELGPDGITVNNIAVGRIDTERLAESFKQRSRADSMNEIPLKRFGTPRELADVVCFLASTRAILDPGGALAVWSASPAPELAASMESVFGNCTEHRFDVLLQERPEEYLLYLSRRT